MQIGRRPIADESRTHGTHFSVDLERFDWTISRSLFE